MLLVDDRGTHGQSAGLPLLQVSCCLHAWTLCATAGVAKGAVMLFKRLELRDWSLDPIVSTTTATKIKPCDDTDVERSSIHIIRTRKQRYHYYYLVSMLCCCLSMNHLMATRWPTSMTRSTANLPRAAIGLPPNKAEMELIQREMQSDMHQVDAILVALTGG